MSYRTLVPLAVAAAMALALPADAEAGKRKRKEREERIAADAAARAAAETAARFASESGARDAFEAGKQYAQSGLYDQAIERFEEALALRPGFAQARMNLGVAYLQKGSDYFPVALGHLERAVKLQEGKRDPLAWYNLTVGYTLVERFDKAFEALDETLACGFQTYDALRTDEDLYELRRRTEFRKILEKHKVFL